MVLTGCYKLKNRTLPVSTYPFNWSKLTIGTGQLGGVMCLDAGHLGDDYCLFGCHPLPKSCVDDFTAHVHISS